jgi:hypothetical protein
MRESATSRENNVLKSGNDVSGRSATLRARLLAGLAALTMLVAATVLLPTGVSNADPPEPPPPPLRHVQYTVFSEQPYAAAEIYYRDTDPPNWQEYSHNP